MARGIRTTNRILLAGLAALVGILAACTAFGPKEQYATLYKISASSETRADGVHAADIMPFYQEDNLYAAIEWRKTPANSSYRFTVISIYKQDSSLLNTQYLLENLGIRIDNGRVVTVAPAESSKEWRGQGGDVDVAETMSVVLDERNIVQPLRVCATLSLQIRGEARVVPLEGLEKVQEFLAAHASK